ncbi:hypothetical protein AJ78_01508 [Emergomyces pasteurianus Ep9510]|uniref:Uncharacterized protein n=1 Tax=Emergomyces pasteurianus Ep9510 TaxID=1447872 RepID=A0A1J9QRE3_9EURO|nr:hypothetical protein AJ78_01508 [Emergomyces pasteurianus Ep9510]
MFGSERRTDLIAEVFSILILNGEDDDEKKAKIRSDISCEFKKGAALSLYIKELGLLGNATEMNLTHRAEEIGANQAGKAIMDVIAVQFRNDAQTFVQRGSLSPILLAENGG